MISILFLLVPLKLTGVFIIRNLLDVGTNTSISTNTGTSTGTSTGTGTSTSTSTTKDGPYEYRYQRHDPEPAAEAKAADHSYDNPKRDAHDDVDDEDDEERNILQLILSSSVDLINLYVTTSTPTKFATTAVDDDIHIDDDDSHNENNDNNVRVLYDQIRAEFCELSWEKQKRDPTTTPMFRDLVYNSERCHGNNNNNSNNNSSGSGNSRGNSGRIEISFSKLMKEIRRYDQEYQGGEQTTATRTRTSTSNQTIVIEPEPSGFIFHESRCGSTALSNALAFASDKFRVYSEAAPTFVALMKICGYHGHGHNHNHNHNHNHDGDFTNLDSSVHCTREMAVQLLRDVVYIMGRRKRNMYADANTDGEGETTHLFFKFQSSMTAHIDLIQEAFPQVPWIFVYRDPVHVMVSNFSDRDRRNGSLGRGRSSSNRISRSSTSTRRRNTPQCATSRRRPPPGLVQQIQIKNNIDNADEVNVNIKMLSDEEYCAAFISYICQCAITALELELELEHFESTSSKGGRYQRRGQRGLALNYDNGHLFDEFIDYVVPFHFNINLKEEEVSRMNMMKHMYSKARGGSQPQSELHFNSNSSSNPNSNSNWYDDSHEKDSRATDAIRRASDKYLVSKYDELEKIRSRSRSRRSRSNES